MERESENNAETRGPGDERLVERFGEALVCVRYRYDEARGRRVKTAEIIVDEAEWTPPPKKFSPEVIVSLGIGYEEKALQRQTRELGGRWDRNRLVWLIRYGSIVGTRLEKFMILEARNK